MATDDSIAIDPLPAAAWLHVGRQVGVERVAAESGGVEAGRDRDVRVVLRCHSRRASSRPVAGAVGLVGRAADEIAAHEARGADEVLGLVRRCERRIADRPRREQQAETGNQPAEPSGLVDLALTHGRARPGTGRGGIGPPAAHRLAR